MKWWYLPVFIVVSCFSTEQTFAGNWYSNAGTVNTLQQQSDTIKWIEDFKLFRAAIFINDRAAVKKYFKLPMVNPSGEIWYLLGVDDKTDKTGKVKTFTEGDLDKYFKKIFTVPFVKSIQKIKTEELYAKNYFETPEQKEGKATTYKMYVTYDKKTKILSFNLAYNTVIKNKEGEIEDGGESNVIYNFIIQKNGHLLFKEIRLAG